MQSAARKPYVSPAVLFEAPLTVECYVCQGLPGLYKQHPAVCRRFQS